MKYKLEHSLWKLFGVNQIVCLKSKEDFFYLPNELDDNVHSVRYLYDMSTCVSNKDVFCLMGVVI